MAMMGKTTSVTQKSSGSFAQQVKDILPSFAIAAIVGVIVYFTGYYLKTGYPIKLFIQVF